MVLPSREAHTLVCVRHRVVSHVVAGWNQFIAVRIGLTTDRHGANSSHLNGPKEDWGQRPQLPLGVPKV